jgi:hypothetical protein
MMVQLRGLARSACNLTLETSTMPCNGEPIAQRHHLIVINSLGGLAFNFLLRASVKTVREGALRSLNTCQCVSPLRL